MHLPQGTDFKRSLLNNVDFYKVFIVRPGGNNEPLLNDHSKNEWRTGTNGELCVQWNSGPINDQTVELYFEAYNSSNVKIFVGKSEEYKNGNKGQVIRHPVVLMKKIITSSIEIYKPTVQKTVINAGKNTMLDVGVKIDIDNFEEPISEILSIEIIDYVKNELKGVATVQSNDWGGNSCTDCTSGCFCIWIWTTLFESKSKYCNR